MKLVYICSPYRGKNTGFAEMFQNKQDAIHHCKLATKQGVIPFAPHLLFTQWLNEALPVERELGMQMALDMLARCSEMWVFADSGISEGMKREIEYAKKLEMPIYYKNWAGGDGEVKTC